MKTIAGRFLARDTSQWIAAEMGKYHISGWSGNGFDGVKTTVVLESMDHFGNWVQFAEHQEDVVKSFDFKIPGYIRFRCTAFSEEDPVVYSLTGD